MYIRFSTVDKAQDACDSINKAFAKRGHTNPVCEVCRESYYWYVREIPVLMPV